MNALNLSRSALAASLLTAALLGGCASMSAPPSPATVSGDALVGPTGMTLYVFDRDAAGTGKSVCNGACATNWPPLKASAGDKARGDYSVITRDDGQLQWAFKGKPLYHWAKDSKPGDRTGDGFNQVWHTARP
jgi:predicted lipoprotein with Yx(FWY)xxD motif